MILKIIHYLESYKAMQKQYNGKWTHNSFYKDIDNIILKLKEEKRINYENRYLIQNELLISHIKDTKEILKILKSDNK